MMLTDAALLATENHSGTAQSLAACPGVARGKYPRRIHTTLACSEDAWKALPFKYVESWRFILRSHGTFHYDDLYVT